MFNRLIIPTNAGTDVANSISIPVLLKPAETLLNAYSIVFGVLVPVLEEVTPPFNSSHNSSNLASICPFVKIPLSFNSVKCATNSSFVVNSSFLILCQYTNLKYTTKYNITMLL